MKEGNEKKQHVKVIRSNARLRRSEGSILRRMSHGYRVANFVTGASTHLAQPYSGKPIRNVGDPDARPCLTMLPS